MHVLRGRPLMFGMNLKLRSTMEFDGKQKHIRVCFCDIEYVDTNPLKAHIDDMPSPHRLGI